MKKEPSTPLLPCPCCGAHTLTERYDLLQGTGYDICSFCDWEDDGTTDIHAYQSINRGSIADYRKRLGMDPKEN